MSAHDARAAADPPADEAELARLRVLLDRARVAAREIDHRAANSLQVAAQLLRLQRRHVEGEEARVAIDAAAGRLAAIARAHRHFSDRATGDRADLALVLDELCADLSLSLGLCCALRGEAPAVPAAVVTPVVVVVNELVVNARKHAYPGEQAGAVTVTLAARDGALSIGVADRGRGLPDGFDAQGARGLGMQVVRATLESLGGRLDVRPAPGGGALFEVTLPLDAPPAAG